MKKTEDAYLEALQQQGIRSIDGLLWKMINCQEADKIAYAGGYMCAERLVKALAEKQERDKA